MATVNAISASVHFKYIYDRVGAPGVVMEGVAVEFSTGFFHLRKCNF